MKALLAENDWRNQKPCPLARVLLVVGSVACLLLAGCSKQAATDSPVQTQQVIKMQARNGSVSVVSVGDILLGSAANEHLATHGYDWPFEHVDGLLESADLVIGNLAAPITTATKKRTSKDDSAYKVKLDSAPALKRAGFHAVSLGNDHMLDYGVAGMRETIAVLRTNNIAVFGAGDSEEEARRGVIYDFGTLRIGLLSYGEGEDNDKRTASGKRGGYALLSQTNAAQDIARMRTQADVVVMSVHWGKNYKDVTESEHKIGRRAIELGADIVFGHHPHIAQGIEIYQGKPIIYSVGNFVFGTRGRYKDKQAYGLVSRWVFEGKTLKWVLTTPIAVNNQLVNFQPRRGTAEEARKEMDARFKKYNTPVRWAGDTAFIGFGADWQSAALPSVPWEKSTDLATNAPPVASVPIPSTP